MTRTETLRGLADGIRADLVDYRSLRVLLDEQFDAALHHRPEALVEIAERVTTLVDTLEQRRAERQDLAHGLLGAAHPLTMEPVFDMLSDASRRVLRSSWDELENLVRECKARNVRNGRLLMDQYEIMQRVLNGEADTYAPL